MGAPSISKESSQYSAIVGNAYIVRAMAILRGRSAVPTDFPIKGFRVTARGLYDFGFGDLGLPWVNEPLD